MQLQKAEPGKTRIGWIGTGVMGRWMCQHLMTKGFKATVYNRSRDKARRCSMPAPNGPTRRKQWPSVRRGLRASSASQGRARGLPRPQGRPGRQQGRRVLVDMTTSEPTLAQEIYAAAKAKGVHSLDAPVSGGDVGAKNAALSIMIGGDKDVVDAVRPLFECMGKTIVHQGPAGAGQHTKMVNQILISVATWSASARALYGYKAGLDLETVFKSVGGGAAASKALKISARASWPATSSPASTSSTSSRTWGSRWTNPKKMGIAMPGLALAHQLYLALQAQGYGRKGTQALLLAWSTFRT